MPGPWWTPFFDKATALSLVISRERCTSTFNHQGGLPVWIKDLKKVRRLGYSLAETTVIEDKAENLSRNYGNLVAVSPFTGSPNDMELPRLADFLEYLNRLPDVRLIEKRSWQRSFPGPAP